MSETNARKRAIIYCRVSTDRQEQDGDSLEYQEEKCRQYAELNNLEVITVLTEARSGFIHYSFRDKLTLARQLICDHIADVIIVWDLRRFSRNFVHSAMIFEEIETAGGTIVSVSEHIDNSLTGKLIRSILAWSAESEREKILEYANRHWKSRLEHGLPIGTGYTRYGWDWGDEEKTFYVINPEEGAVRFSIFQMYVEMDMSMRSIVHKLTEDGVPAPILKRKPSSKPNAVWTHTSIYDILRDVTNVGTLLICRKKNVLDDKGRVKRIPHPEMKTIHNAIPAIVTQTMFDRAQRKLATNKIEQSHLPKNPEAHLLRGHLCCGTCGCRMCTRIMIRQGRPLAYYYCGNRRNKYNACPDIPAIRSDMVDQITWQECCIIFERIDALQSRIQSEIGNEVFRLLEDTTGQEQIVALEATIEYAKQERLNYAEGSYMHTLISQDIATKQEQLERFREECASSGNIAAATALYQERVMEFLDFLNVMKGKYEYSTWQEKRNALDVLGVKVTVAANEVDKRKNGKIPTLEEIRSRMKITYTPIFTNTGVRPSPDELRQDLRALSRKIRPDWDLSTPGLRENWEGDKTSHYPYHEKQ